ncbi:outer membrane transport energization protein TonB [Luteimonas sp. J16]|jgi:protein TonB|uniref:energy transducer TonB n=1 Tax=unclassified Luteimonas TaxID=2629088 RepID=UPI0004B2D0AB|nr:MULTISPECIES: energy transducer TonB [unclassified Luteimonas]TWG88199.1 outer membrane transport energization protein TonB [Luteimonas sp. J16]
MSTPSTPRPWRRKIAAYLPAGRGWWLVAGAVLAGLLLFLLMLANRRDQFEFYRAGEGPAGAPGQVFEPLPAPLPASDSAASGMDGDSDGEAVRIDRHAGAPEPPPGMVDPSTLPAGPDAPATPAAGTTTVPRPVSAPAPDYPRAALRAGRTGQVVLRIDVGADGRPREVSVVESSRHRDLDRAAVRAVQRWRFEPATRDGVAVPATVQQVISFDAQR